MSELSRYWWPVATQRQLGAARPLSRMLLGFPLVLFRDAGGRAAALLDRCPHRLAPLSAGTVQAGEVACPYHGWRFDGAGRCTRVPGVECEPGGKPLVRAMWVCEAHGLVWVCIGENQPAHEPVAPADTDCSVHTFFMTAVVLSTLAEAAENFLDGFHTHFVHAGWVRRDKQRQAVEVQVRSWANGVEAHYRGEGRQSGLVSRWLERDRSESFGRFHSPGVAEVEYRSRRGLTLLVTAWLTPEAEGRLRIHARIATARGWLPAWFKRAVLRQVFGVILRQDRDILEKVQAHAARFPAHVPAGWGLGPLDGPQDFLGPSIRKLLNGEPLPPGQSEVQTIWL